MKKIIFNFYLILFLFYNSHIWAKKNVIIDMDLGIGYAQYYDPHKPADIDDAYALLQIKNSISLEIIGITTVFGNAQLKDVDKSLRGLISNYNMKDILWESGAQSPFLTHKECPKGAEKAAQFLAQVLTVPADVIAIGPLSNIACFIKKYPEKISNINHLLIVMGQSLDTDFSINGVGLMDYNFESDVIATKIVLESSIPIVLFPFELSRESFVMRSELTSIASKSNKAKYIFDNSQRFIDFWQKTFAEDGFHPWDSAPVTYLENAEYFQCEQRFVQIRNDDNKKKLIASNNKLSGKSAHFCHRFSTSEGREKHINKVLNSIK